ncbi:ABC-2 type transport system ATP-binding protein [Catenuloplanes nepalensis]|uniref:ABC-2 type transport system ATP-binding protein n=1 Tax=Catenuloplanes nepalensis TaxID=587533 RepID=A0ABT9N0H4_9ACTN|nr:ABC transporter ATP-binding protein [Catenuloplanes nepalensis]MDP9797201.1 ABC-2 type transport system ATP-binding protein [Catenuloplanes nepalensis]
MSVIELRNLNKRYGDTVAVRDVSLTVEQGEIFGIIGPNGAGKTTTVEMAAGLRRPDGGSVRILGLDPRSDGRELRRRLGMQLQESALPDKLRVGEAMRLYASFYPDPADWRELLDLLGLGEKQNTAFAKLSGGQKQRLSIALALVGNPKVAFLDELTTGLDPAARRETWDLIESVRNRGVTVVLVSHFMEEVDRLCDRIAVIEAGRVLAIDSPAGLIGTAVADRQRIRFVPDAPLPADFLAGTPGVTADRSGRTVVITGGGDLLFTVVSALAAAGVRPRELRMDQATLDDAFLALTGRALDND